MTKMKRSSLTVNDQLTLNMEDRSPFKRTFNFGFNTCHAPLAMRSDMQEQLARAHAELGMRFWRAHGILSDDVGVVTRTSTGRLEYTFSGLKRILDTALRCGVKPFLEISFMPAALARDEKKTITQYPLITSPPKDWLEWKKLIDQLIHFLVETYGILELKRWYFEVWNEPNISFWAGTQDEYFKLYRVAAMALKRVDRDLRVGGPATARAEWVGDLLHFCRKTRTPIDFISTHIYPSDVAFLDSAHGNVQLLGTDFLRDAFRKCRREIDAAGVKLPLIWGEWNSSAGPLHEEHDACNNAALICSTLAGIEEFGDGSLYWNLSDIYEECGYHFKPFHGGYGMYTVDGVAKSAARAFGLWHGLEGDRIGVQGLPTTAARGAFATRHRKSGATGVMLWNHIEPGLKPSPWSITLQMGPSRRRSATVLSIEPQRGSAYETWLALGKPLNLTPAQQQRLEAASQLRSTTSAVDRNGQVHVTVPAGSATRISMITESL